MRCNLAPFPVQSFRWTYLYAKLTFYALAGLHVDFDATVFEKLFNADRLEKLSLLESFLMSRSIKEPLENVHARLFFAFFRQLRKASLLGSLHALYQRGDNYDELHY
jgi:hypothetical protein